MLISKSQFAFVITTAIALTMPRAVSAADYSVAYALEVEGKTETGKIENCNSIDSCRVKFRTTDAMADFTYFTNGNVRGKVMLSMSGDSACCYFKDGNEYLWLDTNTRLHTVTVYAGHARRGNEVIVNRKLGVLYLSFAVSR